ncbi:hypothetical protein Clacol_001085 [Clathrus columnatus]|uniref:YCII-related domain-containing protein n=1 Tax=Clathrus columnatus TaxID=1419009 RepID=A0AAV5A0T3_9AGAM|nr:hypothetical protein Clacol_001085 [Clathrus columnatus]
MSNSNLHSFVLYAPDYTDEGALQRRLAVRGQHFATSHELRGKGVYGVAGGLLSDDGVGAVDPAQKLIGSMIIINAGSLEEARKIAENDVYWTANVWDKERTTLVPFLMAKLSPS